MAKFFSSLFIFTVICLFVVYAFLVYFCAYPITKMAKNYWEGLKRKFQKKKKGRDNHGN